MPLAIIALVIMFIYLAIKGIQGYCFGKRNSSQPGKGMRALSTCVALQILDLVVLFNLDSLFALIPN